MKDDQSILKHKQNENRHPDLSNLRPALFWDTDINKIDWHRQRRAIIERVFERGNEEEREEIKRFYGNSTVSEFVEK